MPITLSNPAGVHTPGAYSHAALVSGATERLVLSGQVGTRPDGTPVEDGVAQIDQALANIGTILEAHGMTKANLVKMTVFLTDPALIPAWRAARGAWLGEHRPASTLLIVAGLADPKFKVEVEAEAAK
ncbi:RidA family protein [Siccirubricoccus sp. KC 17139]|uniref:RidA family protein n=1 Tax=Siccirubricoccus soli TaxID=2899147 RepID=A0ABT1D8D1_9PROT|nr:RidA family protein [Siccirubricoccus soli]MCO6418194.1 RidA family protein [Siccirubricoccus soli]MCP2684329.1 RidA family protein [Siccirubricoccus soli]